MLNKKYKNAIEFIRENLNVCPHCGGRYDVGVDLENNTICVLCSCGHSVYRVQTWDEECYKSIVLALNLKGLEKDWSTVATNRCRYNKLPYCMIRYDTAKIIGSCYTLLEAICGNYVMKDWVGYKDIPLSIGKFEDGKIRIVTLEEVQKELNLINKIKEEK